MLKKIFILIGIILVGILGLFVYIKFKQSKNTVLNTDIEEKNFFDKFMPFDKKDSGISDRDTNNTPVDVSENQEDKDLDNKWGLTQVSTAPVAGFVVYQKERYKNVPTPENQENTETVKNKPTSPTTESVPFIRYVDKATGFIYQTFADKIDERQFSSTIIPKVEEAYFANKGETVVMRYSKENTSSKDLIITFVGTLPKEYLGADSAETNKIIGTFLPENITDLSISPDSSNIFYMFKTGEMTAGILMKAITNTKSQIFDSPFGEWLSVFGDNKTILLTAKPSAQINGVAYTLNSENKFFTKVLGNIAGLVTLPSPDGKKILYSNKNLSLNILNISSNNNVNISLRTLAEKCVWSKGGETIYCAVPKISGKEEYPDVWYQGEVSFDDVIWKIDVETGSTTMLVDLNTIAKQEIDATKLVIDENQNYLLFINKKDSNLWKFDLR